MVKVASFSKSGNKQDASMNLDAEIFGQKPNHQVLDLAYRAYLAAGRSAQPQTLTRGDVSGGGKKPWRQKGTGRARVGSSRVPNWRGGGVTFGPTGNQNHTIKLPVTLKRQAIRHALSAKAAAGAVSVIEQFKIESNKTKDAAALLAKLKLDGQILLVIDNFDPGVMRSCANLANLSTVTASYLNVFTVLNADHIVITKPALDVIGSWLGTKKTKTETSTEAAPKATTKTATAKSTKKAPASKEAA